MNATRILNDLDEVNINLANNTHIQRYLEIIFLVSSVYFFQEYSH